MYNLYCKVLHFPWPCSLFFVFFLAAPEFGQCTVLLMYFLSIKKRYLGQMLLEPELQQLVVFGQEGNWLKVHDIFCQKENVYGVFSFI